MSRQEFKKVLLMGRSGSGKTSMRSIIFANYVARDTMRLAATIDVEHSHLRFLGNLVLNLWDCGGQEAFMESYFESQREHIFKGVQVLIYVFDVDSKNAPRDLQYYKSCADAIAQFSPSAKVFCLLHKMDLIAEDQRDAVFSQKEQDIKQSSTAAHVSCFKTSIWDETLCVHPPACCTRVTCHIFVTCVPPLPQLQGVEPNRVLPHPQRGPA